jgi:two-component system, cell cycle sensor histidine kinase and response regulator CckA
MLAAILEEFGYSPVLARHGEEAIQCYLTGLQAGNPYDAVIMELTIAGGMGGKETMARLKEIDPQIKAIVASGYANDPVVANYGEFGFKGMIHKPFRVSQLSQVLHHVIRE